MEPNKVSLQRLGSRLKARDAGKTMRDGRSVDETPEIELAHAYLAAHPERKNQVLGISDMRGPVSKFATEAAPAIGAIAGGTIGAAAGGLAATPTILGIPAGVIGGGAAGAAVGAGAGETVKEKIQKGEVDAGDVAKTGLEYGALEAIGGPMASLAGKGVKALGETVAKSSIPVNLREAVLSQAYKAKTSFLERIGTALGIAKEEAIQVPTTAGKTAFEKGLAGTQTQIGIQAKRATNTIWDSIVGPALEQSKVTVNMPSFFSKVEEKIIKENPEISRQKQLLKALEAMKEDYASVTDVPLKTLQDYKHGWAEFVPGKAYRGESIEGAFKEVQDEAAGEARKIIYDSLGEGVRQAYFDYGNLQGLMKLGQQAMTGNKLKGGSFAGLHALWDMAAIPVTTIGGQTIYKIGEGIEMVGAPGARTIRDLLGIPLFDTSSDQSDDLK